VAFERVIDPRGLLAVTHQLRWAGLPTARIVRLWHRSDGQVVGFDGARHYVRSPSNPDGRFVEEALSVPQLIDMRAGAAPEWRIDRATPHAIRPFRGGQPVDLRIIDGGVSVVGGEVGRDGADRGPRLPEIAGLPR